jgi:diguanylate cyclase (GGDEF)-like protein/PAS domain S-box-containing protein
LARRALLATAALALGGAGLGLIGIAVGSVVGPEMVLVFSCLLFTSATLVTVLAFRSVALQTVATASTTYYGLYLSAGSIIAVVGAGPHSHLFIYLVWFFPLLAYNKLVNATAVGRSFSYILVLAPVLIVLALWMRSTAVFTPDLLLFLPVYCLSYLTYGLALNVGWLYREEYIVERARADSLKAESDLLESLSDCFISLDSGYRLIYLNEAACLEFGVERRIALNDTIENVVPGFLSEVMLEKFASASSESSASVFEAQNQTRDRWYEMRCSRRPDGMSVHFRNITESVASRRKLDEAHSSLRQQAELLDNAQDAILVLDLDGRIVYWNKGAERIYGWTAAEASGQPVQPGHLSDNEEPSDALATVLEVGAWHGQLWQRRRDGSPLIVESRCTLVMAEDGKPRAILIISTDITERKAIEAKLEHLAFYDDLTQLPNRALLRQRLERALGTVTGEDDVGAILLVDLDDFKTPNATLGRDTGDLLLGQVAVRLTECVAEHDTVARLDGDKFVVMLPALARDAGAAAVEAAAIGDRIRAASLQPYDVGNHEYRGSVSIGIALFVPPESVDELLKRGDLALRAAKAKGRNAMCFFDPRMQTIVDSRAALESDLRRALQNWEFELHYQPQVDGKGGVIGAEALLRWRHPVRGMIPPDEFIPLAEEGGLIVELGRGVLETACSQLAEWAHSPEMEGLIVSVNVSLRQFLAPNFVDQVLEVLRTSGANPRRLKLEITESSMMVDVDETIAKMTALKEQSVGFATDDFGTGYASLSHLKNLPLDIIKIDRSFVSDMLTDDKTATIVRTIVALGRNLNLLLIGEGVETAAQREFLESAGCNFYQGFLFSRALPRPDFEAFVAAARAPSAAAVGAAAKSRRRHQ